MLRDTRYVALSSIGSLSVLLTIVSLGWGGWNEHMPVDYSKDVFRPHRCLGDSVELKVDNGIHWSYFEGWEDSTQAAVRLEADSLDYPLRLLEARFFLYRDREEIPPAADLCIHLYLVSPGGEPGQELGVTDIDTYEIISSPGIDEFHVNLRDLDVVIESPAPFFVAVEWVGQEAPLLSTVMDNAVSIPEGINYFFYRTDGEWSWWEHYDFWFYPDSVGVDMIWAYVELNYEAGMDEDPGCAPQNARTWLSPVPNPFVGEVVITVEGGPWRSDNTGTVSIYDVAGRLVRNLGIITWGSEGKAICWDGTDAQGRPVSPGSYVCRIEGSQEMITGKILRLR